MNPIEILPGVHFVGAVDWDRRNFHGYSVSPKGTTYNAFLLKDQKNTLVDTVSAEFAGTLLCNVARALDGQKLDYIVVNHVEPDHSGALPRLVAAHKPEKIFCSPMGLKCLKEYYDVEGWPLEVVKTGSSLSIGKRELRFVETRMLHWPDSMMTYVAEDKLLISSDAFGQNYASSERFADQVDQGELYTQLVRYYANIVLPYSPIVTKLFAEIGKLGWPIEMIAPDHGLIWRGQGAADVLAHYDRFAKQPAYNKAVITYDSMWHSTEHMAEAIADGLDQEGVSVRLMSLKMNHHSDVMSEIMEAGAVLVGSPTHNNTILPLVSGFLTYMKGLRPQNKIAAGFGSFGWSGECLKQITERLESMGLTVLDGMKVKNAPKHEHLAACVELGRTVARALKEKIEQQG